MYYCTILYNIVLSMENPHILKVLSGSVTVHVSLCFNEHVNYQYKLLWIEALPGYNTHKDIFVYLHKEVPVLRVCTGQPCSFSSSAQDFMLYLLNRFREQFYLFTSNIQVFYLQMHKNNYFPLQSWKGQMQWSLQCDNRMLRIFTMYVRPNIVQVISICVTRKAYLAAKMPDTCYLTILAVSCVKETCLLCPQSLSKIGCKWLFYL